MAETKLDTVEAGLLDLRRRVDELMLRLAVKDEREKHVDAKLDEIKKDVEGLSTLINRVGWIVIAAIISGAMKFILDGGFTIAP